MLLEPDYAHFKRRFALTDERLREIGLPSAADRLHNRYIQYDITCGGPIDIGVIRTRHRKGELIGTTPSLQSRKVSRGHQPFCCGLSPSRSTTRQDTLPTRDLRPLTICPLARGAFPCLHRKNNPNRPVTPFRT